MLGVFMNSYWLVGRRGPDARRSLGRQPWCSPQGGVSLSFLLQAIEPLLVGATV